jgi:hypothetical protein
VGLGLGIGINDILFLLKKYRNSGKIPDLAGKIPDIH